MDARERALAAEPSVRQTVHMRGPPNDSLMPSGVSMSIGTERAFVYVANAESRELLVFRLDLANGALTLVEHVLGGKFTTLCFTPERRFMFAGLRDEPFGVASFAIEPD